MAFPNDLSGVEVFKIHPAIGCARLANNEEYYEFFDYHERRKAGQAETLKYMSVRDGKHWMKRQAVRFRIFAYSADGGELGELTAQIMGQLGVRATWTAQVANRKLNVWSQGTTPVVAATASATGGEAKQLFGANPWRAGNVWLGEIHGDGLFVPPMGGAYRITENTKIPPFGAHRSDNGILDTTSDGSVSVELAGAGDIPVVPACVIVAPQDHSPDIDPEDFRGFPEDTGLNLDFVVETRALLGIAADGVLAGAGYEMDIVMMKTMNAEYSPGMEICLDGGIALPDPAGAFYARGEDHIHEHEIRPSYQPGKTLHGQLTAGLCSAWQTDLTECLNYWTSTYPHHVTYASPPQTRVLARKAFASHEPEESDPEWLNAYIDMMDVGRSTGGTVVAPAGTERDANDNAGEAPVAPFSLDPRSAGV